MLKYAKLHSDNKTYMVTDCTNPNFIKEWGFELVDIEQDYNGMWYKVGDIPQKSDEELLKMYNNMILKILNEEARKLLYDDYKSICLYENCGIQKYHDESICFKQWMASVWNSAYDLFNSVIKKHKHLPTEEELKNTLPTLNIIYTKE